MKLNNVSSSLVFLMVGLVSFAVGMIPGNSVVTSFAFLGACVCWLIALFCGLLGRRQSQTPERRRTAIMIVCAALLVVFGCLFCGGLSNARKQQARQAAVPAHGASSLAASFDVESATPSLSVDEAAEALDRGNDD